VNLPPEVLAVRRRIADTYLRGEGIEIGALYAPLQTSARVRYVDRMTVEQLRGQYPELSNTALTPVDRIDDGERLVSFPDESLDFIIANHMLEHCENPLGTIRVHLERLRRGGILYYAVPDKRNSFDIDRPITSFEHLVDDDKDGGEATRFGHYMEWARLVNHIEAPADAHRNAVEAMRIRYSIHFHVWDPSAWLEFLSQAARYLASPFEVLLFEQNDTEIICVLRRNA
jgi:SAM-dependent methyltransferase